MATDPFAVFAPTPRERPATERPSLRAEVEELANQVAALRDLVERNLLPVLAGQGVPSLAGQFAPGLGSLVPANAGMPMPGIFGQQFLQPVLITQHDARRTILHHLGGAEVTIGGIEQHIEINPLTGSRTSEQTMHRYLSLDGRAIHDQGEVYACTSCHQFPLVAPRFCTSCQEPTCSSCIIGSETGSFCRQHGPHPSFWESLFG